MIQIARLKHREFGDLLFGLRVRTVSYRDFAVLQAHGFCGVGRLKSLANSKVPVGSRLIVIVKALVQHAVALAFRHVREHALLDLSQTDKFHDKPLLR